MSRRALQRQFLSLWTGELAAALALLPLYLVLQERERQPLGLGVAYSFGLLAFVLLQGAAYWFICWRWGWKLSPALAGVYRYLRALNVFFLLALPLVCLTHPQQLGVAVSVGLLAAVEFINYYVWRLSYPLPVLLRRLWRLDFPPSLLSRNLG